MKTCLAGPNIATIPLVIALTWLFLVGSTVGTANAAEFRVFDATIFKGKPDLSRFGLTQLRLADGHTLWTHGASADSVPDLAQIRDTMTGKADPAGMLVIDIENWPVQGDPATVSASVARYVETLKRFREIAPGMRFGYYGTVPIRDYWRTISDPSSSDYGGWQRENSALKQIADNVDTIFPSLYTFFPDEAGWQKYAKANLAEARRLANGKPVYCFLWPQFHESGYRPFDFLPAEYWALELDICRKLADGIVIWGGYTMLPDDHFHALPWDDSALWWQATLKFLAKNGITGK